MVIIICSLEIFNARLLCKTNDGIYCGLKIFSILLQWITKLSGENKFNKFHMYLYINNEFA